MESILEEKDEALELVRKSRHRKVDLEGSTVGTDRQGRMWLETAQMRARRKKEIEDAIHTVIRILGWFAVIAFVICCRKAPEWSGIWMACMLGLAAAAGTLELVRIVSWDPESPWKREERW